MQTKHGLISVLFLATALGSSSVWGEVVDISEKDTVVANIQLSGGEVALFLCGKEAPNEESTDVVCTEAEAKETKRIPVRLFNERMILASNLPQVEHITHIKLDPSKLSAYYLQKVGKILLVHRKKLWGIWEEHKNDTWPPIEVLEAIHFTNLVVGRVHYMHLAYSSLESGGLFNLHRVAKNAKAGLPGLEVDQPMIEKYFKDSMALRMLLVYPFTLGGTSYSALFE